MKDITIAIEGSTYAGSVAILRGSEVLSERSLRGEEGSAHRTERGERLMPALADCIAETGVSRHDVTRIVCGAGPGSFTSLRVAGSVAKGLATGYGVDLYAVNSLLLTVAGLIQEERAVDRLRRKTPSAMLAPGPHLSLVDAMRGEFFGLRVLIEEAGTVKPMGRVELMTTDDIAELRQRKAILRCIGPGQEIDVGPHARGVGVLLESILEQGPVDLASWEPDYGRLAEAQVRWEAAHGRPLTT
ncbi:MAG TPA: tRNA (adenosine(37)-N6)-threonylcarbamoyltransferase complex dimerization subunit type 1 TsaB [Gemmatimonadaceae bacterium]